MGQKQAHQVNQATLIPGAVIGQKEEGSSLYVLVDIVLIQSESNNYHD